MSKSEKELLWASEVKRLYGIDFPAGDNRRCPFESEKYRRRVRHLVASTRLPPLVKKYWAVQLMKPKTFNGKQHFSSLKNVLEGHVRICHDDRCSCGAVFGDSKSRFDHVRSFTRHPTKESSKGMVNGFFPFRKTPKSRQPSFWPWSLMHNKGSPTTWVKFLVGGVKLEEAKLKEDITRMKAEAEAIKDERKSEEMGTYYCQPSETE